MKDIKLFLSKVNWWIVYSLGVTVWLTIVLTRSYSHECVVYTPEIEEKKQELINEINEAEDKDTLDSLALILFGFKSR